MAKVTSKTPAVNTDAQVIDAQSPVGQTAPEEPAGPAEHEEAGPMPTPETIAEVQQLAMPQPELEVYATQRTIRDFRVYLDSLGLTLSNLTHAYQTTTGFIVNKGAEISAEVKAALDHLRSAKSWLGKVMEARGYDYPYGKNYQTVADIMATADTAEPEDAYPSSAGYVGHLSDTRDRLGFALGKLAELQPERPESRNEAVAWTQCYVHLCEAKMSLGFEFQRLKQQHELAQ